MNQWIKDVDMFHKYMKIPQGVELRKASVDEYEADLFEKLRILSKNMYHVFLSTQQFEHLRMHLILEEAYETCVAIAEGNKVKTLDGLCDLMYVTIGTALTFKLPLELGWVEVQKSNMSKMPSDVRCSDKGPNFKKPDLEKLF